MPRQTGKGSRKRREAAFERRATQHHDFIGEADAERAESKALEHERLEAERKEDVVREMADEVEQAAGLTGNGAMGPELPLRIPRSLDEGKRMIREAPELLREKARERLDKLPEPAKKAVQMVETAATLLMIPARVGFNFAREMLRVPAALVRVLRHREV